MALSLSPVRTWTAGDIRPGLKSGASGTAQAAVPVDSEGGLYGLGPTALTLTRSRYSDRGDGLEETITSTTPPRGWAYHAVMHELDS